MVNPNSGHELANMRSRDRSCPCYLRHPDVSIWEAVGFYEGVTNMVKELPALMRVRGCWKDENEFEEAWGSDAFCDVADAVNQAPRQYTEPTGGRGRQAGGRASSPRQQRR